MDKNKVLRQISEKLIDLQSNLEREKSRIETEMAQKNKIIQRLKHNNESLKEKLNSIEKKNCIFTKLDEDNSSDSGRESDAVSEDDKLPCSLNILPTSSSSSDVKTSPCEIRGTKTFLLRG